MTTECVIRYAHGTTYRADCQCFDSC